MVNNVSKIPLWIHDELWSINLSNTTKTRRHGDHINRTDEDRDKELEERG